MSHWQSATYKHFHWMIGYFLSWNFAINASAPGYIRRLLVYHIKGCFEEGTYRLLGSLTHSYPPFKYPYISSMPDISYVFYFHVPCPNEYKVTTFSIQVVNYTSFDFTTVDVKVDEEFASIVTRPNKGNTLKARGGVDKLEWNQGVSWLAVGDSRTELRYSGPASFGFQILTYPQACEIGSRRRFCHYECDNNY